MECGMPCDAGNAVSKASLNLRNSYSPACTVVTMAIRSRSSQFFRISNLPSLSMLKFNAELTGAATRHPG